MKSTLLKFTCCVILLVIFSCKKNPIPVQPDPEPSGSLTRTLVFPNQGGLIKQAQYTEATKPETRVTKADNRLLLSISIAPKTTNSAGDGIVIAIDDSHLQNNLVKDYDFINPSARIIFTRYTYSYMENTGDTWSSFTDSQTGVVFEGVLHITGYDKDRKLVAGSYSLVARNLINDPTIKNIGAPIDPINQCNLTITGSFTNIKILEP